MNNPVKDVYKSQALKAIMLVCLGYVAFSLADTNAKFLQADYTAYQILTTVGLCGTILTGIWIMAARGLQGFCSVNLKWQIGRAFIIYGTSFCVVSALDTLPLAEFYGVIFASPFILLIMVAMLVKEHIGWRRWLAVTVGFLGVLILAGPQFQTMSMGLLFALGAAVLTSANILVVRKIGHGDFLPLFAFFPFALIFALNLICGLAENAFTPIEAAHVPLFLVQAPFLTAALMLCARGFAISPETAIIAPFHYTQILWGVLFGFLLFGDIPTWTTAAGLILIVGAGLYSIYREYKIAHARA